MNKKELSIVVVLFVCLFVWMGVTNYISRVEQTSKPKITRTVETNTVAGAEQISAGTGAVKQAAISAADPKPAAAKTETPVATAGEGHKDAKPTILKLSNSEAEISVSSWGGAVVAVELKKYKADLSKTSGPVVLDFSVDPALALTGIGNLGTNNDFQISLEEKDNLIRLSRTTADGLKFERTLKLKDSYHLEVADTFTAAGSNTELKSYGVAIGPMMLMESTGPAMGTTYLGVDTHSALVTDGVTYWGNEKIPALFGYNSSFMSCGRQNYALMPAEVHHKSEEPLLWAAVKNKFFVQILAPGEGETTGCDISSARDLKKKDLFEITSVSAVVKMKEKVLESGKPLTRKMEYYVGPKEYSVLKQLGNRQSDVMDFGKWFGWLCPPLLISLNFIYGLIPNYGVAIILLALAVKLLFLPLTNKSAQSMKELQKYQPKINEINEKFKDNPQRKNEAIMEFYREHNINPLAPLLGGCLPMLIQIPVFIALFTVLRSAVELRHSSFLWINDLSEPENLFAGMLPVPFPINLLPLLMALTTVWQQKMTPSTADPQQQKMMLMMSFVMMFFMYSLPAAPLLYWTASTVMAVIQLYWQKYLAARKEAAA